MTDISPVVSSGSVPQIAPPASTSEPVTVAWSGSPWSLAGLGLINMLLTILTVGIYQFWGTTEVRRRIWSSVRINGEPLEYTGTGKELFLGFLIVFGLVLLPMFLIIFGLQIWLGPESPWLAVALLGVYTAVFFLIGVAIYRARRYRLSRTRWRGIRGALVGVPSHYAMRYFFSLLLIPVTLGWIMPWRSNMLYRAITNDTRFGDEPFSYTGKADKLYVPYILAWVGGIVSYFAAIGVFVLVFQDRLKEPELETGQPAAFSFVENLMIIGIVMGALLLISLFSAWYQARKLSVFAEHTRVDGARFRLNATAPGLMWQFVSNYLLSLLSLGILRPVAEARMSRYLVDRLSVEGTIDFAKIAQSQQALDKTGEGLATAFDVDAFG